MKKLLASLFLAASFMAFGANKFYVGTNAEFKPYEYLEDGKITGFDYEFMNALAKEVGIENVEWVNMSFDGLIPAINTGKLDAVIAGMSQTEERKKAVTFTDPYMFVTTIHYVLVNKNSTLTKKEEIKDKVVGVQMGTMQESVAKDLGSKVKPYNTFTGALMDLEADKIDAVIISDSTGEEYLKTMKGIKKIDVVKDTRKGASIALKKGQDELAEKFNKAMKKLRDDGRYLALLQKYFPARVEEYKNALAEGKFDNK